jgi:hypothetical protein
LQAAGGCIDHSVLRSWHVCVTGRGGGAVIDLAIHVLSFVDTVKRLAEPGESPVAQMVHKLDV